MTISEDTFLKNMGIRIRQLREKKEFSQEYLVNICDIPKNQIGRIERAEINTTIKTIVKIANALEIEPKELFNLKS